MATLKLRPVAIDTYKENVAFMHRGCTVYHSEGFQALNKIEIHREDDGVPVIAVLNIVDDETITAPGELGLSEQVFQQLGLPPETPVTVKHATPPLSIESVHAKIEGEALDRQQYLDIIQDIVENRYSKIEMAAFLVGCAETGFERDEVLYLTQAMVETGDRLEWNEPLVADKHCIGGIPGNRTTMLIVPIVAAHGTCMPKTSSRAITSPAGTADTMEVLAEVDLPPEKLHRWSVLSPWIPRARWWPRSSPRKWPPAHRTCSSTCPWVPRPRCAATRMHCGCASCSSMWGTASA